MTQRNPMNERYQSKPPAGQTRKSAASAKPATKAAASVYIQGRKSNTKVGFFARAQAKSAAAEAKRDAARKRAGDTNPRRVKPEYYNVPTQEYRTVRRVWWILIAFALVGMLLSVLARDFFPDNIFVATGIMAVSYIAIFAALFLDLFKTRKIRLRYQAQCEAELKSKAGKRAAKERARLEREQQKLAESLKEERTEEKQGFLDRINPFKPKAKVNQVDTSESGEVQVHESKEQNA